ncbi:RNA polymerase sigma factor [Bacteroides ihuae]|uniref:RNA polymerase sigma factor n=1 Tax=Bacteroides ihuae TaxID=1852362 RepID=UPI0008DB0D17|nr:sigma-70 family RNA polymerase sigma factor [Bacteroides ihuae]
MSTTAKLSLDDEQLLLNRFLKGNDKDFTLLYRHYVNQLMAYGIGWGIDRETLKDAIQDVFYKLYCNRKAFEGATNPKSYLIRALKNRIIDLQKSNIKTTGLTELEFSVVPTVLDSMIAEEERETIEQQIQQYLNLLTGRQREAVYLRFIEEMEYEEIAEILDMTAPAARKLICRAIARIRTEEISLVLFLCLSRIIK